VSGDFIAEFAQACPDWVLSFYPLRLRPMVYRRAERVVVVDATLTLGEKASQVHAAIEAVLHPDDAHPGVTVIDQG
jgi:hypothetical protein